MTDIIVANGYIHGVKTEHDGHFEDIETDTVLLCTGHSARDTVRTLYAHGVRMMQKPFSVGARIEHPREFIDRAQYGDFAGHPALGAADYKLACHPEHGRGAYTFCMCPGGTVVNAASEEGGIVVNGMSEYGRDAENSNSALLVGIEPENFGSDHRSREWICRERSNTRRFLRAAAITPPRRSLSVISLRTDPLPASARFIRAARQAL